VNDVFWLVLFILVNFYLIKKFSKRDVNLLIHFDKPKYKDAYLNDLVVVTLR
jgi:hypothetical protein